MFAGEALCLLIWAGDHWLRTLDGRKLMYLEFPNDEASFNKRRTPFWWWIFPSFCDLLFNTFMNISFSYLYASTVTVLSNLQLILCSFLVMIVMRTPMRLHQWIGVLAMTAGMALSSVPALRNPETETDVDSTKAWLGIVLMVCSSLATALQTVLEEWILRRTYFPLMGSLAIEGLWGMVLCVIAMVMSHVIGWHDFSEAWYQMHNSGTLLTANILCLFNCTLVTAGSLAVIKLGSGMLRTVVWSLRAPLVWVVELSIDWQDYHYEQLVALFVLAVGFALYIYLLPGLSRERQPKAYNALRLQIPCFCTKPLSDNSMISTLR